MTGGNRIPDERMDRLRDPERLEQLKMDEVMRQLVSPEINSAVDVGAGTGVYTEALRQAGVSEIIAVDVSEKMLEELIRWTPNVRTIQADASYVPLDDNCVDLALSAFCLHEVDDALTALTQWKRLARRRLAVIDWIPYDDPENPRASRHLPIEEIHALGRRAGLGEPNTFAQPRWALHVWDLST